MPDIFVVTDHAPPPGHAKGLIPRDFTKHPQGYLKCARPFDLPLLDDQAIELAIKTQETEGSSLQHVRDRANGGQPIPSLDQDGQGYCWSYSTTSATMLALAAAGIPHERLSGHMMACIIKHYQDQGGFNAQSVAFAAENGIATVKFWTEKSMSRSNDTPEMRADAKTRAVVEYMDLDDGSNEELLKRQLATCYCLNIACAEDFDFWSHSVCGCRVWKWGPNGRDFEKDIWNSWRDDWGNRGMGRLTGSKAIPQGAIAVRVIGGKA